MSQDVARRELTDVERLAAEVRSEAVRSQVEAALPEGMSPHRFVRAAATAIIDKPELLECERKSLFTSLVRAAQDGLVPDGQEAALVPYKKKGETKKRVQYLPMIGGFRKIAAEHGWSLRTRVVYTRDSFDFVAGEKPSVYHKPAQGDRGEMGLAYAIAKHRTKGDVELEVMTAAEIEKVRATSRAADSGPWVDWPERMWEKTVGRRLFKQLPLDPKDKERIESVLRAEELAPDRVGELVYGEEREGLPASGGEPAAAHSSPDASAAAAEPAITPAGSEPLFEGEEPGPPEPEPEPDPDEDELALARSMILPAEFKRFAGKSIGEVLNEERAYVEWLANEVNDPTIREAARAALAAQS